jgi:plastocyanin
MTRLWQTSRFVLGAVAAALALGACRVNEIAPPEPGTAFVQMRDNLFAPQTVTVAVGRSVRWTNQGQQVHTIASPSQTFDSDLVYPTAWFEARFETPGTYDYTCSLHPEMTGTIIVQ